MCLSPCVPWPRSHFVKGIAALRTIRRLGTLGTQFLAGLGVKSPGHPLYGLAGYSSPALEKPPSSASTRRKHIHQFSIPVHPSLLDHPPLNYHTTNSHQHPT